MFTDIDIWTYAYDGNGNLISDDQFDGLPSDVQELAIASSPPGVTTLYAGAWGDGVSRSIGHDAAWLTVTAGLTRPTYIRGGLAVNPVRLTVLLAGMKRLEHGLLG